MPFLFVNLYYAHKQIILPSFQTMLVLLNPFNENANNIVVRHANSMPSGKLFHCSSCTPNSHHLHFVTTSLIKVQRILKDAHSSNHTWLVLVQVMPDHGFEEERS